VEAVAVRLGIGERQLRRLFEQHLGAPPISVAQTRRLLFAKQLIHDTTLSMGDVAAASGFGSVRRFNDAFVKLYGRTPLALRRHRQSERRGTAAVTVRLSYRPPYDWDAILDFLGKRAIAGIEVVEHGRYLRTIELEGTVGSVEVAPGRGHLLATIRFAKIRALLGIVGRLRRLFDLGRVDKGILSKALM
jgi:AraC family transcriptional regulator of adaptative response / DNA-3-methyladenine glycosylase II